MEEKQKKESNETLSVSEEAGKKYFFRFHIPYIQDICESRLFDVFIHLIIALHNAFIIICDFLEDDPLKEALYGNGHNFFLLVYLTEFMMKVYVHPRDYWRSPCNILSFIVVLALCICACVGIRWQDSSILPVFLSPRLLNTLPNQEVLQAMIAAYLRATKTSLLFLGLLLELMLIYAVVGHDFFASTDPETWGDLSEALLALFSLLAIDDWTDIQKRLWDQGFSTSWMFTISFIILGHFLFIKMIISIYIIHASRLGIKQKIKQKNTVTKSKLLSLEQDKIIQDLLQEQRGTDIQKDIENLLKKIEKSVDHKVIGTKSWSTTVPYMTELLSELDRQNKISAELQQLYSEVLSVLKEMLDLENLTDGAETINIK